MRFDKKVLKLDEQLFQFLAAVLVTIAAYGILRLVGPFQVWVQGHPTSYVAPTLFLAVVGLPFGLLLAEAIVYLRKYGFSYKGLALPIMMAALVSLSFLRYLAPSIGISSHSLVLSFFYIHNLADKPQGRTWKMLLVLPVFLYTAWMKIIMWSDPYSFFSGFVLGIVPWIAWRLVTGKNAIPA